MTQQGKSYWLTSGLYTILQRGSALVINFGTTACLTRMLGPEGFGVWSLFNIIGFNFIEVARSGLIQNALVRYLAIAHKDDHPRIITASFTLNLMLTSMTILLLTFGSNFLGQVLKTPELANLLYFYIFTTLALIPYFQFQYIQQGNLDFKGIFWGNLIRQGLFFIVVFSASVLNYNLSFLNLVNLQTIAAFAGAIVSYFFVRKFLKFSSKIDWVWVKRLFDYGKYVFVTNLSATIFGAIDTIMLSAFITKNDPTLRKDALNINNKEAAGLQGAALRITNMVEVPTNAMADIVFPQSARRMETQGKEAVKYLYEKSVGIIVALIVPAMAIILLLPKLVVLIVAGKDYLNAAYILQITALYSIFVPFDRQSGAILDSIGKQKLNFFLTMFNALVNIGTNYLYIKVLGFGVIGASYGTLTTYITAFIIRQIILRYELGVNIFNIFKEAFKFYGQLWRMVKSKLG
jgi:O-antigen/teichoic acid export membrane protein